MFKAFELTFKAFECPFKTYERRFLLILRTIIPRCFAFLIKRIQNRNECFCYFEWSMISHAPFGALANSV